MVLFAKIAGVQGVRNVWPWPSVEAWAIIGAFGGLQALLQLGLPGKEHHGPVSPKGNVPVYKVAMRKVCSATGYPETVNVTSAIGSGHLPHRTLSLPVITSRSKVCQAMVHRGQQGCSMGEMQEDNCRNTILTCVCRQMECTRTLQH